MPRMCTPRRTPEASSISGFKIKEGYLDVSGGHRIYWRQSGSTYAPKCLVIHGGPGAGSSDQVLALFDLDRICIVQIDQRGAGRSTPAGSLRANTTADLVRDMEDVRRHLGIDRWFIFAGSWGTTLALLYAAGQPSRCDGMILRGITAWTDDKFDWVLGHRRFLAPAAHRYLTGILSDAEKRDILTAYHTRILAGERDAAVRWHLYEKHFLSPIPVRPVGDERDLGAGFEVKAKIHIHYYKNRAFFDDDQMHIAVSALRTMPIWIVHGSLDFLCPPIFAYELAQMLPSADLRMVPGAGHSADDPGIKSALVDVIHEAGLS